MDNGLNYNLKDLAMIFDELFHSDDIEIKSYLLPNEKVLFEKWFMLADGRDFYLDDVDGYFVMTDQRVLMFSLEKTLIGAIPIKNLSIIIDNYQYLLTDDLKFLPKTERLQPILIIQVKDLRLSLLFKFEMRSDSSSQRYLLSSDSIYVGIFLLIKKLKNNQKNYQREIEILNNGWSNENLISIVQREIGQILRGDQGYMKRYYEKKESNIFTKDFSDYILTFFIFMIELAVCLVLFYSRKVDSGYSLQEDWYYGAYFIYILIKPIILDLNRIKNKIKLIPGSIYFYYCFQLFLMYLYYQMLDGGISDKIHILPKMKFLQQISANTALVWLLIDLASTVAIFSIKHFMNLEMFRHQSKVYKYTMNYMIIPTLASMLVLALIVVFEVVF